MNFKVLTAVLLFSLLSGCASVNVRTDNLPEAQVPPTFEQSYVFWWWGIVGDYTINVREVCMGKGVKQMQAVNTFTDTIISTLTIGIYVKRTARVWCKDE